MFVLYKDDTIGVKHIPEYDVLSGKEDVLHIGMLYKI
jgi:hypothetical protein